MLQKTLRSSPGSYKVPFIRHTHRFTRLPREKTHECARSQTRGGQNCKASSSPGKQTWGKHTDEPWMNYTPGNHHSRANGHRQIVCLPASTPVPRTSWHLRLLALSSPAQVCSRRRACRSAARS